MSRYEASAPTSGPHGDDRPAQSIGSPWDPLYRTGAVCATLAVLSYAVALIIVVVAEAPPTSGGAEVLAFVAAHRTIYIVRQVLWLLPSVLLMVVFLALAVALRNRGRSFAAVAGLITISSWAMSLAWPTTGDGSPAMVLLSDRYAAATTAGEQAPFVGGAEVLLALNDVPAVIGVLQTFGILLISLLMRRGPFAAGLAWLGIATGTIGMVAELLRPVLGWAYAVYGLLLFGWLIGIAGALWRHPRRHAPAREAP
ncbi:hypothetical protein [Actinoplanes sp. NPDC023714]|uniref:hypothetical protein n=1 Tax=Actinoplanes sp. NPDC023714 TaxID=3154322 RepID=UPI003404EB67